MKKRFMIFALTLAFALLLPGMTVKADSNNHDHTGWTEWTSDNTLPTTSGNYYLTKNVKLNTYCRIPSETGGSVTINLCLNGFVIDLNGYSMMQPNMTDWTLDLEYNIYDEGQTEHHFSVDQDNGRWILDENEGTKTLYGGIITNASGYTAAITTDYAKSAKVTLNGANFVGNSTTTLIRLSASQYSGHELILNSGSIIGNTANQDRCGMISLGGGMADVAASFVMNGGIIAENHWTGGTQYNRDFLIRGYGGNVTINGGEISDNSVPDGYIVLAGDYNNGSLYINGGVIKNNTAYYAVLASTYTNNFKLLGGKIVNNNAKGIQVRAKDTCECIIGGDAEVSGNVYNSEANNAYIMSLFSIGSGDNAPKQGMKIGVNKGSSIGQFTKNGTAEDIQYFFSDSENLYINYNSGGYFELKRPAAVNINSLTHGTVSPSKNTGVLGETITLTVTPDTGYKLKADSLKAKYNDGSEKFAELTKISETSYSFTMPAYAVTVSAEFVANPTITVVQNGTDPVYGTPISDDDFYSVTTSNFGTAPTLTLEWKNASDEWETTAPSGITASVTGNYISVETADTLNAGSYVFRVTNGETGEGFVASAETTLNVEKAAGSGTVSMTGWTYGGTASSPVPVSATNGTGNVTYSYKVQGADDSTYSSTKPSSAGDYTVKAVFAETVNYLEAAATADFTISKAPVDSPSIPSVVFDGNSHTAEVPNDTLYTVVTNNGGTDVGFYDVVLQLTDTGNYFWKDAVTPSDAQITLKFEISAIPKYAVSGYSGPEGTVSSDKTNVEAGEIITLTVVSSEGYELKSLTAATGSGFVTVTPEVAPGVNTYTFTMPAAAVTVSAQFERKYSPSPDPGPTPAPTPEKPDKLPPKKTPDEKKDPVVIEIDTTGTTGGETIVNAIKESGKKDIVFKADEKTVDEQGEENKSTAEAREGSTNEITKDSETRSVVLDTDVLDALVNSEEVESLTVMTSVADVEFDAKTLESVKEQSDGSIKLVVTLVKEEMAQTAEEDNKVFFDVSIVREDGSKITNFDGGNLKVTLPIPKAIQKEKVVVVYFDGKEHYSPVNGTVNDNGTFTFRTGHLSEYILMTKREAEALYNRVNDFETLKAHVKKSTAKTITLKWNQYEDADGYMVFGSLCNGKGNTYKVKKLATIKNPAKTKFKVKGLKEATSYKFIVKAYKVVDDEKYITVKSMNVHGSTLGGPLQTAKLVIGQTGMEKKNTLTLKKGESYKISESCLNAKGEEVNHIHTRFETTDKTVANVSKNGEITAKGKGKCSILVVAEDGLYEKIKVRVAK